MRPATLCPSGLDGTCAAAGGSPFQACYLLLNKAAAGDRTQSSDGQRASERVKARGLLLPWSGGRGAGAVGLFKTPCLCEGHLSLRPVTMATGPAQCRGEGGERGDRYHGNTSCHGNSSDEGREEVSLSLLKRQEPLHKLMTCVIL